MALNLQVVANTSAVYRATIAKCFCFGRCRTVYSVPYLATRNKTRASQRLDLRVCVRRAQNKDAQIALQDYSTHQDVDKDLWSVLELATDEELEDLYNILHGPSVFSPFIKNLLAEREPAAIHTRGRTSLMYKIENRFRFLAADSVSIIRGQRPSYREALLKIRDRLSVPCTSTMPTHDLEVEVFLHIVQKHLDVVEGLADEHNNTATAASYVVSGDGMADIRDQTSASSSQNRLLNFVRAPFKVSAPDLLPAVVKFFSAATFTRVTGTSMQKLATNLFTQHARYEAALSTLCSMASKGVGASVQRKAAVQAAQKGFTAAMTKYTAMRSAVQLLHPLMWTWLGLDLVMMSIGTDYSRLLKAVFELAQIRLLRTHGFTQPALQDWPVAQEGRQWSDC